MASGSTEVGSIKGLLELDITDYMEGIEKAKTAEQELKHGDGDTDLRIGADVHEAVEKMDEVTAKADKLGDESKDIRMDADVDEAVGKIQAVAATVDEATGDEKEVQVGADVQEAMGKVEQVATVADDLEAKRVQMRVDARVDEAMARIDEVTAKADGAAKTHTVIVDAKTGKAVGEIEAVRTAETSLERSNARLSEAYSELDAVQSQTVFSQSSLMTAEAAATRVEEEQAAAQKKLNLVLAEYEVALQADATASTADASASGREASQTNRVAEAKRSGAAASQADAKATETDTAAKNANADASERQAASQNMLRNTLLLVAPALVPIAGAAAGAGTALIGMAASGILAFRGVNTAMDEGSLTGQQYSADLRSLGNDMDRLSNTGAVAYLSGMNQVAGELHGSMPVLNGDVSMFSRGLGTISGNALQGVLGLLREMTPVLVSVDSGLERSSAKFASWGTGSGAKQFVSYLISTLPSVGSALSSLIGAAGHVASAFGPWGSLVLTAVTDVSDVIQAIPTPVLSVLATGAMAAYTAFKLFGAITPIIEGVQAAMEGLAGGEAAASLASLATPLGAVTVAVGLLGAAYAAVAGKNRQATNAQQDYTSALQQSNGVVDQNVAKSVAKQAKDSGALDTAGQLGIAQGKVTDAITGQNDAYDSLTKSLQKTIDSGTTYTTTQYGMSVYQDKNAKAAQQLLNTVKEQHGAYQKAADDQKQVAAASQDTTTKLSAQAQILGLSQGEWTRLQNAETQASAAAKDYKSALDLLNGQAQNLDQATSTLTMQFDTMASTIRQNISQVGKAKATSMDVNTTYGAKNHQLIEQTVKDAQDEADSIINSEGKSQKAYLDANQSLTESRQKILDVAAANGLNRNQVSALLDQIMKMPADPTTHIMVDDDQAKSELKNLGVTAANVSKDEKTITITGDNKKAMDAIAKVTGAKIDDKTGKLTLDKQQYDVALAIANGAAIDTKTGQLKADNNEYWQKLAQTNGWKIDPHTGLLIGDNGQYMSALGIANASTLNDKQSVLRAIDQASGVVATVEQEKIHDKYFRIVTDYIHNNIETGGNFDNSGVPFAAGLGKGYTGGEFDGRSFLKGYASGGEFEGAVTGPYSPVKDNVILQNARLNPGEHVLTVDDVRAMGGQKAVYAFRSSLHNPKPVYRTREEVDRIPQRKHETRPIQIIVQGNGDPDATARRTYELFRQKLEV
ncbi:hypothetical protein OZX57_06525 [Bifidobacterium sp. ESL0682]|uniref:hypothetical protein n=1 Tax=Bifidobacterium sp. ESL0682 TaxID=2983212 RepID=UPI0023F85E4C|nr:hypothetical protein [Bifidobacterium sp. ESL0682]WEV41641.1 hypothetical protein OZX57_06525 [Bifidobacterium sp. ESL0682]